MSEQGKGRRQRECDHLKGRSTYDNNGTLKNSIY